jgi:hypothetical protein
LFLTFIFYVPAFAYLDPGTGSMLWQTVVALLAGATYFLKLNWRRIKAFLAKSGKKEQDLK